MSLIFSMKKPLLMLILFGSMRVHHQFTMTTPPTAATDALFDTTSIVPKDHPVEILASLGNKFQTLAASIKDLTPSENPWVNVDVYAVGSIHTVHVCNCVSFGYFVKFNTGATGLMKVDDAITPLVDGENITVTIAEVNPELEKIIVLPAQT